MRQTDLAYRLIEFTCEMSATPFHHGLEIRCESPEYLRFGCLRLMHLMMGLERTGLPTWTKRWRSRHFFQNTAKFQELFWRFDRVSEHVGCCERAIRRWQVDRADSQDGSRVNDPDLLAFHNAVSDLPIFVESQLVYLRTQIDVFTTFVMYLYERHPNLHSFRNMRKWFTEKRPDHDEVFSRVLESQTEWFDLLSGDSPKGLRELVVHYRGTHQLGWRRSQDGAFQLMPAIVNDVGIASENVAHDVRTITEGWFRFLDSAFVHFEERLLAIGLTPEQFSDTDRSVMLKCNGLWRESYWVYPKKRLF